MQKYELVKKDFLELQGRRLYRIRALYDFADVKKGDLGGYICGHSNIYDIDKNNKSAWVYPDGRLYNSRIMRGTKVISGTIINSDLDYGTIVKNSKLVDCNMHGVDITKSELHKVVAREGVKFLNLKSPYADRLRDLLIRYNEREITPEWISNTIVIQWSGNPCVFYKDNTGNIKALIHLSGDMNEDELKINIKEVDMFTFYDVRYRKEYVKLFEYARHMFNTRNGFEKSEHYEGGGLNDRRRVFARRIQSKRFGSKRGRGKE